MDIHRHILMIGRQRNLDKKNITFKLIYLFSTIFAFQSMLTAYMSSSYIEQFIDPKTVGAIYAIVVTALVYRELTWEGFRRAVINSVRTTAMVMTLVACASAFAYLLTL